VDVSPDSAESRIRQLEAEVASLKTRAERQETDIRATEGDVKALGPLLIAQARVEEQMGALRAEVATVVQSVAILRAEWKVSVEHTEGELDKIRETQTTDRLERERIRASREEREREREKVDRRHRLTTIFAATGLVLTAIGLAVTILTVGHP
jgi:predicted  nucleic acid-binding Zn-ribbon protein